MNLYLTVTDYGEAALNIPMATSIWALKKIFFRIALARIFSKLANTPLGMSHRSGFSLEGMKIDLY